MRYAVEINIFDVFEYEANDMETAIECAKDEAVSAFNVDYSQVSIGAVKEVK